MKPTKRILIPSLLPALLALAVGLSDQSVRADSGVAVPPIHLVNLNPAAGKYLNVFYLMASEPELGLKGTQLEITQIMAPPVRLQIPTNGTVDLPSTFVPRDHFKSFNYVYFAITEEQPNPLYLRNRTGRIDPGTGKPIAIKDPRISDDQLAALPDSAFQTVHTGFLSKFAFPGHTQNGVIVVDALKDFLQTAQPNQ